jgi:hypothetical protein
MILRSIVACLVVSMTTPAIADEFSSLQIASTLGDMVGSERVCGFAVNEDRLAAYVSAHIDATDMEFADNMALAARVMPDKFAEMNGSMQRVHCVQMTRLVVSLGLAK